MTRGATIRQWAPALLAAAASVLVIIVPALAAIPQYKQTDITPWTGVGTLRFDVGLNAKGHVSGEKAGATAFFYNGALKDLGKPAGSKWSAAPSVSNSDVMAGDAQLKSGLAAYAITLKSAGTPMWTRLKTLQGHPYAEALSITPDGTAIVGFVCGSWNCSSRRPHTLAVIWNRSNGAFGRPKNLQINHSMTTGSKVVDIAKNGRVRVVIGYVGSGKQSKEEVWTVNGSHYLHLSPAGSPTAIAHGKGTIFYVSGTISERNSSVTKAIRWTLTCVASGCKQTGSVTLTPWGTGEDVNSSGEVIGYDRTDGGAGYDYLWENGTKNQLPFSNVSSLNNAGQITGTGYAYDPYRSFVFLETPTIQPA